MVKILKYSDIVEEFLKRGCVLLEETYKNNRTPMRYICDSGKESKICYTNFLRRGRCAACYGNKKLDIKDVKKEFRDKGCVLLEETYKNNTTCMRYICNCGKESKISYKNFKKEKRCADCGGNKKLDIKDVKKKFFDKGCVLLEETYKNNRTPMRYICKCGNESQIRYDNFTDGGRCMDCRGNKKLDIRDVKKKFLDKGCILLEETYINAHSPMRYICNCGNTSTIRYCNFINGNTCAKCKNKTELIVNDFLESNYSNIIFQPKFEWCKNKTFLPFDFLLDDLKILIEVDGPQHFIQVSNWDSPEKTLERDIFKTKTALKHGYSVIRICQADIYHNTVDWKTLLNDAVKYCSKIECVFISKEAGLYNNHKAFAKS